jgi:hypothetical protein
MTSVLVKQLSNQIISVVSVAAFCLISVACFVSFLWSFHYLPGTDAYYYALQAQSLLDTGHVKVADHGLVYYLIASASRLGFSIESAFRITLTLVFTTYQLAMSLVLLRIRPASQPILLLVWALCTPLIAFHTIEFPNAALALSVLPLWFWLALKPLKGWKSLLASMLLASAVAHPAAAGLALVFGGVLVLEAVAGHHSQFEEPVSGLLVPVFGLAAVAIVILYIGISRHLLSFNIGVPALVSLVFGTDVPHAMTLIILLVWMMLAVLILARWRYCSKRWKSACIAALALPWWPDQPAGLTGLGGRLSVIFVLFAVPLIVVVWNETAEWKPFSCLSHTWAQKLVTLGFLVALMLLPLQSRSYRELLATDEYSSYERVVTALRNRNIPMLIAHRGLDFFYTYRLKRDAFHFDPDRGWDLRETWRVAEQITPEEMAYYSPPNCPWGKTADLLPGTDVVLVREDCWEDFRLRINKVDNPDLYTEVWENSENPSQPRPDFLRKRACRHLSLRSQPRAGFGPSP